MTFTSSQRVSASAMSKMRIGRSASCEHSIPGSTSVKSRCSLALSVLQPYRRVTIPLLVWYPKTTSMSYCTFSPISKRSLMTILCSTKTNISSGSRISSLTSSTSSSYVLTLSRLSFTNFIRNSLRKAKIFSSMVTSSLRSTFSQMVALILIFLCTMKT